MSHQNYQYNEASGTKRMWHYTTPEGADQIMRDGYIQPSTRAGRSGDCAFGEGTYLTSKHPQYNSRNEMARNNYDGQGRSNWSKDKCTVGVEVHVPVENLHKADTPGRNVYKYDGGIDVNQYGTGRVLPTEKRYK